jgi:hypothetical protein
MSAGRRAGGIWDLRITPPLSARVDVSGANGLLAIMPSIGSNRRLLEIIAHPEQLTSSALSAHNRQTLCDVSLLIWWVTCASALSRRFSELAVFDACLYIRVRRIDEPA